MSRRTTLKIAVRLEGLSSFYAADLRKIAVAVQKGDFGQGFAQFMLGATPARVAQRVDVRDSASFEVLREILAPKNMPKGRWPSDHALAFSQQVAVNSAFLDFAANAGLFSVNGPPGTGKTTLLRDVVAEVVTERAAKLVKLGSNAFGVKGRTKVGDANASFYPWTSCFRASPSWSPPMAMGLRRTSLSNCLPWVPCQPVWPSSNYCVSLPPSSPKRVRGGSLLRRLASVATEQTLCSVSGGCRAKCAASG